MVSMEVSKALFAIVFLLATWGLSLLPWALKSLLPKVDTKRWIAIANAGAGGVFLAAAFVHLLSEATELVDVSGVSIPLTEFLIPLGILSVFTLEKVVFLHDHKSEEEALLVKPPYQPNRMPSYLLTAILSFHSVIEGLAIGVASSASVATTTMIAIGTHKWLEALALGISYVKCELPPKKMAGLGLVYSIMTPIGIVIGVIILLSIPNASTTVVEACFLSFATGTFTYVGLIDILVEEFKEEKDKWWKYLSMLVGFVLLSVIVLTLTHEGDEH